MHFHIKLKYLCLLNSAIELLAAGIGAISRGKPKWIVFYFLFFGFAGNEESWRDCVVDIGCAESKLLDDSTNHCR